MCVEHAQMPSRRTTRDKINLKNFYVLTTTYYLLLTTQSVLNTHRCLQDGQPATKLTWKTGMGINAFLHTTHLFPDKFCPYLHAPMRVPVLRSCCRVPLQCWREKMNGCPQQCTHGGKSTLKGACFNHPLCNCSALWEAYDCYLSFVHRFFKLILSRVVRLEDICACSTHFE